MTFTKHDTGREDERKVTETYKQVMGNCKSTFMKVDLQFPMTFFFQVVDFQIFIIYQNFHLIKLIVPVEFNVLRPALPKKEEKYNTM